MDGPGILRVDSPHGEKGDLLQLGREMVLYLLWGNLVCGCVYVYVCMYMCNGCMCCVHMCICVCMLESHAVFFLN